MNKQVDFYITQHTRFEDNAGLCIKLIQKAYSQELTMDVQLASHDLTQDIDKRLWSDCPTSFIPHHISESNTQLIQVVKKKADEPEVLINCSPPEQLIHERWSRLLQIVPKEDSVLAQARERYRYYQQQGYLVKSHNIG